MRRILCVVILAGFIGTVLVSCQKEVEGTLPGLVQGDSTFLDKVIALDTTLPSGLDTTSKMTFTYDNAKRVIKVSEIYGGNSGSSIADFYFNGTDSIPYKKISREIYTGIYDYTDTSFYVYSNGVVSKDSTITHDNTNGVIGAAVVIYTVNGSNINKVIREYNFNGGVFVLSNTSNSTITVSISGGNIVTQTLVTGMNAFQSVQATYDNKPNPLYRIFSVHYPELDTPTWIAWLLQKNNPSNVQFQEMGGPSETESYIYSYRLDGYPTKFVYSSTTGVAASNKILFYYKHP